MAYERDLKARQGEENWLGMEGIPITENFSFAVAWVYWLRFTWVIPLSGEVEASGFFVKQPFQQRQLTSLKTGEIKLLYVPNNTAMEPILGYKPFICGQTDTVNSLNNTNKLLTI